MLTYFDLVVNSLTEENDQNKTLKSLSVEVKVLTLALHFSLSLCCLYIFFNVLTYLFSLGLRSVYVKSMLGC